MAISYQGYTVKQGCGHVSVDLDNEGQISASVGAGGANTKRDTRTVQALLNGIGPLEGGPPEMLAVDGIVGPKTLAAIRNFQTAQAGIVDGRVDPAGRTIKALRNPPDTLQPVVGFSSGGARPSAKLPVNPLPGPPGGASKAAIYKSRMDRAVAAWPDAKAALTKALLHIGFAATAASGPEFPGHGPNLDILFAHKHFRTGEKHSAAVSADLRLIEHVYRFMAVVMESHVGYFGGTPWGKKIFDIDRFPNLNKKTAAYTGLGAMHVPSSKVDRRYNHPIMGSTVYLCDDIDTQPPDVFSSIILHEIAHMVGSTHRGMGIADYGYGWEVAKYNSLGKWHRMHNAENFALYAFELQFGTRRLFDVTNNDGFEIAPIVANGGFMN
jgi:hypothetical protein